MKAPRRIDKYLREAGFGYAKPYYMRHDKSGLLTEAWLASKESFGWEFRGMVFYPVDVGGPGISPTEIEVLLPSDPKLILTDEHGQSGWDISDQDAAVLALASDGESHLRMLCDPCLMLDVYEYLTNISVPVDQCPKQFLALKGPYVRRMETPLRLLSMAAYHNLAGNYDKAISLIEKIPTTLIGQAHEKVLADAKAKEVQVSQEDIDYMASIGSRVTQSRGQD